ncbi:predicted protein [Naegleria gruberi]|uniref:Predicted protein n=1 Tax=Naegleria gruberi TaxID=5762 RepID=D2V839_NAEGR|nr:uncharacterized protein NAEGRDRAFT_65019 [Naegleria gruberi]EFC47112.1 predicted protein [Naegleria gruberi]|eukprot:XP_002679856.1 predicted protein [Naegleria gruberi strain NEG-M]
MKQFSLNVRFLMMMMLLTIIGVMVVKGVDPDDFNIIYPGEEATYNFDDDDDVVYYKLESVEATMNMTLLSGFIEVCSGRANIFIKECSATPESPCDFSDKWVPSAINYDRQFVIQPTAPFQYPTGICQGGPNVKCTSQIAYYIAITPVTKGVVSRIVISGYTTKIAGRVNLITTDNRGLNFLPNDRALSFSTPTYCASETEGGCKNELVPTPAYVACMSPNSATANIASVCGCRNKPINLQGCTDLNGVTTCRLDKGIVSDLNSGLYSINILVNKEDIPELPEFAYLPSVFYYEQPSNAVGIAFGIIFAVIAVGVIVGGIVGGVIFYRKYKAKKYQEINGN